jgi:hypothetical protein
MTLPNPNKNAQLAETAIGELPAFVKEIPPPNGSAFPAVQHYWMPERTGNPELDERRGRQHFKEAVAFSYRPNAQMFLAHVLVAMFQNLGPMESGFIDALLEAALVGAPPPALTDEEIAVIADTPQDAAQLRALESEISEAIASRGWLPDILRLHLVRCLSGANGEFIGGAVTMIARMALNGSRN